MDWRDIVLMPLYLAYQLIYWFADVVTSLGVPPQYVHFVFVGLLMCGYMGAHFYGEWKKRRNHVNP